MIEDKSVELALDYVRDHADRIGQLRGQKAYLEHHMKVILAQHFLRTDGTVAERDAMARAHPDYVTLVQEYRDAVTELETLLTYFKAAELRIEVWRTQNANLRRGNI